MCTLGVQDILDDAISTFRERLTGIDIERFALITSDHVKRDILDVQSRQERQKSMLNLARFDTALSAFQKLEDTAQLTQEQAGFIWGPIRNTLRIANDNRDIFDPILTAYFELGTSVPRTIPHHDILQARPELCKALAFMYHDILAFQADVFLTLNSGPDLKQTFKASWHDYTNHTFQSLLRRFDQHHKLFESQLNASHKETVDGLSHQLDGLVQDYREDREISLRHIHQYEDDRRILLKNASDEEAKRKEDQLEQILDWLSTPGVDEEQEEHHQRFREARGEADKTCQWVFQNDDMLNWLNPETAPPSSIIWIHGKMGCGKSVLASSIIDHCMNYQPSNSKAENISFIVPSHIPVFKTSFFYCQEEGSRQNDTLVIYKSLLRQMLQQYQQLLPVCHEKKAKGQVTLNQEETAQALLNLFTNADMSQFIIIDGIDACSVATRRVVIDFLSRLVESCEANKPGKLRLLLVSRDLPSLGRLNAAETAATTIEMTAKVVQGDIGLYLDAQTLKMKGFGLKQHDIERIPKQIHKHSNGMFLYARIVMDNLLAQSTVSDVLEVLESSRFPTDLASAYKAIVDRLKKKHDERTWKRARRIFSWLACGKRPLLWHEIQAGLVIAHDRTTGELILDYYHHKLRHNVQQMCGSLIQVLKGRITFVHPTAREHILQSEDLDKRMIECELAIACLTYLAGPCFQPATIQDQVDKYIDNKLYAFHDYASSKWNFHLEAVQQNGAAIFADSRTGRSLERSFTKAIAAFTNAFAVSLNQQHQTTGTPNTDNPEGMSSDTSGPRQKAELACEAFRQYSFYAPLVTIWTHLEVSSRTMNAQQRNKISIDELGMSVKNIRSRMETKWANLPIHGTGRIDFAETYGTHIFKCDRIACDYFYMGFETGDLRDAHARRHERPFLCPVEGCSTVQFGFSTNKDREKHIRNYHPDDPANTTFGPVPRDLIPGAKDNARFNCPHCGKSFTRKAIRNDHVNSHFGERPHQCSLCSKAFVRANDLKRHVTNIHDRRPRRLIRA